MARETPYGAYNFAVEISGVTAEAGFSEVSGLDVTLGIVRYRNGIDRFTKVLSTSPQPVHVVLRRGYTASNELYLWFDETRDLGSEQSKRSMSIILHDEAHNEVARWNLFEAFPFRWTPPALDANTGMIAIEEVEIVASIVEMG